MNRSTGVLALLFSGLPTKPPDSTLEFVTCGAAGGTPERFGGLLTVTLNVMVMLLPIGSVNPDPVPLMVMVPLGGGGANSEVIVALLFVSIARQR